MRVAASISASVSGAEGGRARARPAQVPANDLLRQFRVNDGKLEVKVLLAGDLVHDVDHPGEPGI
jgi:hypothetical protein